MTPSKLQALVSEAVDFQLTSKVVNFSDKPK
jgi:hypothetical protein